MQINSAKPRVSEEGVERVAGLLREGRLAKGAVVAEFAQELKQYLENDGDELYVLPTSSGTSALHLALIAAGIGQGDIVIVPSFTFAATAAAVHMVGALPYFVEISPDTFGISPVALRQMMDDMFIKRKAKAIIPVHLFGQIVHQEVFDIAREHGLIIIEDACQAIGARLNNLQAGTLGDYGVFSFYATKNVFCGEGGAVITRDKRKALLIEEASNHGMVEKYYSSRVGYNYRMTDINAAIGLDSFSRITRNNLGRRCNAHAYNQRLMGLADMDRIKLPPHYLRNSHSSYAHVWHQYSITVVENRDGLLQYLRDNGVGATVNYPYPLHKQPAFIRPVPKFPLGYTEWLCDHVLSLPVHPGVSVEEINYVCDQIEVCYGYH